MKRYLLSIILCLCASCAWAFPPGFIGAVASGVGSAPDGFVGNTSTSTTVFEVAGLATNQSFYQVYTPAQSGPVKYFHIYFGGYDTGADDTNVGILSADGQNLIASGVMRGYDDTQEWVHFELTSEITVSTSTPIMLAVSRNGVSFIGSSSDGNAGTHYYRQSTTTVSSPFTSPMAAGTARTAHDIMVYVDNSPTGSL